MSFSIFAVGDVDGGTDEELLFANRETAREQAVLIFEDSEQEDTTELQFSFRPPTAGWIELHLGSGVSHAAESYEFFTVTEKPDDMNIDPNPYIYVREVTVHESTDELI